MTWNLFIHLWRPLTVGFINLTYYNPSGLFNGFDVVHETDIEAVTRAEPSDSLESMAGYDIREV